MSRALPIARLLCAATFALAAADPSLAAQSALPLYEPPPAGVQTRWASPENPSFVSVVPTVDARRGATLIERRPASGVRPECYFCDAIAT